MGWTNFPNGITSMGLPVFGSLPTIRGTWFFVNPDTTFSETQNPYPGSASNDGKSMRKPFASIATAYTACTSGAGDGIVLLGGGTTTAECTSYLTASITWSKWGITVFGVCAPTRMAQRARISTSLNTLTNLITITGSNNSFYNVSLYNGGTSGAGCVSVTGNRNYFENVHFIGAAGVSSAAATDYDLTIAGGQENTFVRCVIGSDTADRGDVAGANLLLDDGAQRNRFYECEFIAYRTAGTTAGSILLVGTGDSITRTHIFDRCMFHMYRDGSVTAEASVVIGTAPNNGFIIFNDCTRHGFTDWGAVAATGRVYSASKANTEAGGITIAANPS